ncbi:MAG: gamma-glutamyltransferase family protein [Planctomycetes bacterium]|nr:gamma-glutamyltransferase family protein [Planctomycetota bacterium]
MAMGCLLAVCFCGVPAVARPTFTAVGTQGMVASDSEFASRAGCEVLKAGGNAVDAAVATSLALCVARPFSTGLGGGGFMMVRLGDTGDVYVLDYRECAPAAATPDMYVKARAASPDGPPASQYGGLAAGVPGLPAGLQAALERFGSRPLGELIEPARRLAAEGFPVDRSYLAAAKDLREEVARYPGLRKIAAGTQRTFLVGREDPRRRAGMPAPQATPPTLPGNREDLAEGMIVRQPELAAALELIGRQGVDEFYRGRIAKAIVEAVRAAGGIMTVEDLAGYKPVWREALRTRYRDRYEVLLMPPPSSGGVAIAETLNILEHWDLAAIHQRDVGLAAHLTVEAVKHAFADRARYLGDADFARVPIARLTDKDHAARLAARIREAAVSAVDAYGSAPRDDAGTTHFCVADRRGNVVSVTETINTEWGCLVMAEPWGIVLNNEMDDFDVEPGKPNAYNLLQSTANAVGPGKRPLSSMSPTIVLADGKPVLVVGASGGPRIISGTLQVLVNVLDYGLGLDEAVARPRFHHQWQPNEVYRNDYAADDPVVVGLRDRGHKISRRRLGAIVLALRIEPGRFTGASDPRKGGRPAGY